jgi:sensor histidine kinase YesM
MESILNQDFFFIAPSSYFHKLYRPNKSSSITTELMSILFILFFVTLFLFSFVSCPYNIESISSVNQMSCFEDDDHSYINKLMNEKLKEICKYHRSCPEMKKVHKELETPCKKNE